MFAEVPDTIVDHRQSACPDCGLTLSLDLSAETVSVHDRIELPEVKLVVEQIRRVAVVCPGCRNHGLPPHPASAASTPFGPRLPASAVYLKTLEAMSYERLQKALSDLFGFRVSQGGRPCGNGQVSFRAQSEAARSGSTRPQATSIMPRKFPLRRPRRSTCGSG